LKAAMEMAKERVVEAMKAKGKAERVMSLLLEHLTIKS
jgi:hypothetical protein